MLRSTRYTTRQRAAVLACLKERTGQYLGVQDVADAVKKLGVSVGLTTIYRNLDTLVEEGAVRKFVVDKNSAAVYEYLDDPHTEEFHVKCRACGTLFHLRCSEIERMAAALSGVMPAVSRAWAASGPLKVFSRMKRRRARILRRASRTGSSRPTVKRFAR